MSAQEIKKTVKISEDNWEKLSLLKIKRKAKSIDAVLEDIISEEVEP